MRLTERLRGQRRLQISDMVPSPRLLEPPARHHVYLSFRNGNVGGTPDATVAHDLALMLEAKGVSVWRDAYWDTTQPNAMNGKQQSEGASASALGAAAPAAAPSVFVGASVTAPPPTAQCGGGVLFEALSRQTVMDYITGAFSLRPSQTCDEAGAAEVGHTQSTGDTSATSPVLPLSSASGAALDAEAAA